VATALAELAEWIHEQVALIDPLFNIHCGL
jgi:hypothetical protein